MPRHRLVSRTKAGCKDSLEILRSTQIGFRVEIQGSWKTILRSEKKMETTVVYYGYIGAMEKKMETTTVYEVHIGMKLL